MTDSIPYTHWAYFTDRDAAEACGRELDTRFDCLTVVESAAIGPVPWLLRAARSVSLDTDWHDEIREVVQRHGGDYDGGESGWMDFTPNGVVYLDAGKES